jgi:hypothetical protein
MAKISEQARKKYSEKIKEYKKAISQLQGEEHKIALTLVKGNKEQNLLRIQLADKNLNLVSYYTLLNNLSVSLLGVKQETSLNNARKCCYKSIIYLEEVVSRYVDAPFSDYEENLLSIENYNDIARYNLARKLGFSIAIVENGYGENSKWKWSFVDIRGRYASVTKNMINFKTLLGKLDPRIEGYAERREHLELAKKLLRTASDGHREKYELSTRRIDDMQLAINYLLALKRIYLVTGEAENAEVTQKKIDVWKAKMEADMKEQKQKKI